MNEEQSVCNLGRIIGGKERKYSQRKIMIKIFEGK